MSGEGWDCLLGIAASCDPSLNTDGQAASFKPGILVRNVKQDLAVCSSSRGDKQDRHQKAYQDLPAL